MTLSFVAEARAFSRRGRHKMAFATAQVLCLAGKDPPGLPL